MQAALKRSPLEIEERTDRYSGLMALIRLPKTLQQLRDEEHQFNAAMGSAFNHVRVVLGLREPKCGWNLIGTGYDCYGTS